MQINDKNEVILHNANLGNFRALQLIIEASRMDLIQKHKIKAIYLGEAEIRYIADWESIFMEYFYAIST